MDNYQAYYWTPEWQEGEKEADEDIKEGRVRQFSTAEALIADLKASSNCYIDENGEIKNDHND